MDDLVDWILREAITGDDLGTIVKGFAQRIAARGVPLLRASIVIPALDPSVPTSAAKSATAARARQSIAGDAQGRAFPPQLSMSSRQIVAELSSTPPR
jgi:hypothetical protein